MRFPPAEPVLVVPSKPLLPVLLATVTALLVCACATSRIPATPQATYSVSSSVGLAKGVTYWSETRKSPLRQVYHVVRLDLTDPYLQLFVSPSSNAAGQYRARTVSRFVSSSGALLGINASYFLPFAPGTPGGDDFVPQTDQFVEALGQVIVGGRRLPVNAARDPRVNAILCIHRANLEIRAGSACRWDAVDAVAAGPLLLNDGIEQSFEHADPKYAREHHPRTAIGIAADGRSGWLVVVDGRQSVLSEGATLFELSAFFRDLGAADAINLDGGGSTTLAIDDGFGKPRVLNSPIHTGVPGRERPVANQLGVRRTDQAATIDSPIAPAVASN